jgi:hypothetical protein
LGLGLDGLGLDGPLASGVGGEDAGTLSPDAAVVLSAGRVDDDPSGGPSGAAAASASSGAD